MTAINSGAALRVSFIQSLGGFNPNYKLTVSIIGCSGNSTREEKALHCQALSLSTNFPLLTTGIKSV